MRQYSIQNVLDWLDFKGLLKNRHYAEASILCRLNSQASIKSLKNNIQPLNLLIIVLVSSCMFFLLSQTVPEKYQLIAFVIFSLLAFTFSLWSQKPSQTLPLLTGCFVAIGFGSVYLSLNNVLQPIYHQVGILSICLHIGLLLIITAHLFMLQRDKHFTFCKGFFVLSFALSGLVGLIHPAILIAALITLTSYKQANVFMVVFGLCLVALSAGWFIYNLDFTWHQKSILMMAIGVILLLIQSMMRHFDWQDEG